MSVLVEAINHQIEQSIYEEESQEAKFKLASQCNAIKKIAIITVVVAPIFAFFLPSIFGLVACLAIGLAGYDIFNMADNLGDAARMSARMSSEWEDFESSQSNVDMLVDSTLLAKALYGRIGK